MSKGSMAKSLKESMELMHKDYRYNKALMERYYLNNYIYCRENFGLENVLYIKTIVFVSSCILFGYISGLFLHYTWKDGSNWSYIESWAIWYAMFRVGYYYGYNTDVWLRRVESGNYDRDILNEVGSSNENPIDLTEEEEENEEEDGNETEEVEEEELTEEEEKKKERFEKECMEDIDKIMKNLTKKVEEEEPKEIDL